MVDIWLLKINIIDGFLSIKVKNLLKTGYFSFGIGGHRASFEDIIFEVVLGEEDIIFVVFKLS